MPEHRARAKAIAFSGFLRSGTCVWPEPYFHKTQSLQVWIESQCKSLLANHSSVDIQGACIIGRVFSSVGSPFISSRLSVPFSFPALTSMALFLTLAPKSSRTSLRLPTSASPSHSNHGATIARCSLPLSLLMVCLPQCLWQCVSRVVGLSLVE